MTAVLGNDPFSFLGRYIFCLGAFAVDFLGMGGVPGDVI